MDKRDEITEFFGEPISVYTSNQAEEDGILVSTGHPLINYITTNLHSKLIEPYIVEGVNEADLIKNLLNGAIVEMKKIYLASGKKEDWFYSFKIEGYMLFCCLNETSKFTLMMPEDY